MTRLWIATLAASLVIGAALWLLTPERWGLPWTQALMIGATLHFGALHRFVVRATEPTGTGRRLGRGALLSGLLARAGVFIALAGFQALICFEWLPDVDVRFGYVIASSWLFALALIDPPGWVGAARERVDRTAAVDRSAAVD